MSVKSGLGQGLGALIPQDFDTEVLLEAGERVLQVSPEKLAPNPQQPRTTFDELALDELAASIKRHGIVQPLVVTEVGDGYEIIAGERRWRAARRARLKTVPVIVRSMQQQEQLEVALIENVQRVDLDALEQAVSIERLHQQFNLAYSEIAKRLGKSEPTISNTIRLLQLPIAAKKALQSGAISEGHARQILALKGQAEKQEELLRLITTQHLNVRQAERFVNSLKSGKNNESSTRRAVGVENKETASLSRRYKTPVKIYRTAKGGRLELYFSSDEDLSRLINELSVS
ncbi:ParB/RepB/Spo0J family partition protein [Candidatus Saccharibacteria bacterium]|nr:MAG: ParB/RepB/Spo0J family partition protein [Candidatus Saccharibacteria bacterium]